MFAYFKRPAIYEKAKTIPQKNKDDVRAVLKVLDGFLSGSEYFAGNKLTIADFSILTSVTSFFVSFYIKLLHLDLKCSLLGNGLQLDGI